MPNMLENSIWVIMALLITLIIVFILYIQTIVKLKKKKNLLQSFKIEIESMKVKFQAEKEKNISLSTENHFLTNEIDRNSAYLKDLEKDLKEKQYAYQNLSLNHQELIAENNHLSEKLKEDKIQLEKIEERFKEEFENLSQRILETKSKKYLEQNQNQISEILKPLKNKISDFENNLSKQHTYQTERNASLDQQLKHLFELNQNITEETKNLTHALKGESKFQGMWGEMLLESILEKSGLRRGAEFTVQQSYVYNHQRLIPDVVLHLPQNKQVIIDSKVSLTAYEKYVNESFESSSIFLKQHVNSLKKHIDELANKDYLKIPDLNVQNYILMFVPLDAALIAAQNLEPNLFNLAYSKGIILVSPSSLHSVLASVSSLWQHEKQHKNAEKIAYEAGKLHDKFVALTELMLKLGAQIETTNKTYDVAMKKLTGRQNLIKDIYKLQRLGAKTNKQLNFQEEE